MADATGLSESVACGEPLDRLVPDIARRGLISRLRRVADGLGVEVLAPAFHKYLIPCPPRDPTSRFERMRQHVTIAPLRDRNGIAGLVVTIEDVTARFDRDLRLAADLDSHDEAIRLRAAETLAAGGESPSLLADALADESWRVRRVAANGMAASGGREVVEKLVEALREHHRDPALLSAVLTALSKTREDVVMTVAGLLEDPDTEVRTYSALALGIMDDPRSVPALIARLDDTDVNVRFHAIEALGRIRDPDAVDALMEIAASRDFFLSFAALDALAAIGDSSVVPHLLELLDDEMLLVAIVGCLGALATEEAVGPLVRLLLRPRAPLAAISSALAAIADRVQTQIGEGSVVADLTRRVVTSAALNSLVDAARRASDDELPGLLVVLSWLPFDEIDETLAGFLVHPAVRQTAAELLSTRGAAAARHIERVADGQAEDTRRLAARALGAIGNRESVATLVRWLDGERDVVIAAAAALGAIGDRRAFEPLFALFDHPEASIRQSAVAALDSIGHPRMEEAIAGGLKSDSPRVRESAARVAGYFGYGSCLRRLVDLCDDEVALVRRAAVEHLASFEEAQAWSKIREVLSSDSDATVRAAAARATGLWTSPSAVVALVEATRDDNLWVRYFAVRAMANIGTTHADALARFAECAMRDTAPPVRIAAIEALVAARSESMLGVLLPLVRDPEVDVACAAAVALGSFAGSDSDAALRSVLESSDARLQHAALDAIGRRSVDAARQVVDLARATRDDAVREHAVRTLGLIGGTPGASGLLELSADRGMRELVAAALASFDAADTAALAGPLELAEESRRRFVVEALSRMRNPRVSVLLRTALDDSSPSVRAAAARALARLDLRDARGRFTGDRIDHTSHVRADVPAIS